jgi:hypothetical protein
MRDSSVSCALSGLTLHSEPVWFVPLVKTKSAEPIKGSRLFGYSSDACALFSPLNLPYKGRLNEYGYIEEFEEDGENIRLIEEHMGMSIRQFTDSCIWGEEITVNEETHLGVGCFIHPEVYDRFSKPVTGGKYAPTLWAAAYVGTRHLEAIGCQFHREAEGRYRYVYKHPSVEGVSFHSDGKFSYMIDDASGEQLWGHGLNDMQVSLRKAGFNIFPQEDVRKTKSISELQTFYKSEAHKIAKCEFFSHLSLGGFQVLDSMDINLLKKYIEVFAQDRLLDRMEQLHYLLKAFCKANRLLLPTIAGSQLPEHQATSVITGCIDKIAKNRLKTPQTTDTPRMIH